MRIISFFVKMSIILLPVYIFFAIFAPMKQVVKNILGYFLIALYMCFTVSTSMFIHTHYYEGESVVHSHPFLMGEGGALNHTHTVSQSVFIHYISSTLLLVISSAIGVAVLFTTLSKE